MTAFVVIAVAAYLVGSVPLALWAGKLSAGVDVRDHGSRSAGATNVARVVSWKAGLIVAALDAGKGWTATVAAPLLAAGLRPEAGWAEVVAGVAVVAGHRWPLFAGFRGGKGVASAAGALLAIDPPVALAVSAVFVLLVVLTRIVSAASLVATLLVLPLLYLSQNLRGEPISGAWLAFGTALPILIAVAHRPNIVRILAGREPRIGADR